MDEESSGKREDDEPHPPPVPLNYRVPREEPRRPVVGPFIGGALLSTFLVGSLLIMLLLDIHGSSNRPPIFELLMVLFGALLFVAMIESARRGHRDRRFVVTPFLLGVIAGAGMACLLAGLCFGAG